MVEKNIPVERMRSEVSLVNPNGFRISELYATRGVEDVSRPHRLNFSALVYVTEGEGVHYVDHQMYVLKPGTLITIGRNQIHGFAQSRTVNGFVIPFNCSYLSNGPDDPHVDLMLDAITHINRIPNVGENVDTLIQLLSEEFESTSEFKAEVIRGLLRAVLLKCVVPEYLAMQSLPMTTNTHTDFIRLKQYIEANFAERPSTTDIALVLGKSVKQLDKLARSNTGDSVKDLVDDRVLVEVKRLLAFSQYSIADIAAKLGFNEATNMTKFFKRHTEISPKDFRQLCRMGLCNR
ncbi:AraC family transcriptional regulator [Enterovibrio makurazakiensis]|uniref:AraC family transcriptional regulator n=1 Tax=Enterovibrio makurazakiensis TaxID=2910232 RepID=UPI003D20E5F9